MPLPIRKTRAAVALFALLTASPATRSQQETQPLSPSLSTAEDGILTLHASTHLVVLDVTVMDWKGDPATGLKKEQFHLLEDGHEQTIKNFEEHTPIDPKVARERLAALTAKLPPNTFTNLKPFPTAATVNVVVMDTLTSRPDTQQNFHQDLSRYMSTVPAGTPFILFHLDSQLHMVQELSGDPSVLRDAVASKRFAVTAQTQASFDQKRLIVGSAVDQLTKYLGGIPGRKTLLWFSGSLGGDLSATGHNYDDPTEGMLFCKWTDDLQQHRIATYRYLPERKFASGLGCSPGFTVDGSIAGVVDSGSHFYTLSYTPTNALWDGKLRKFKVNVSGRHGLSFDYRQGYKASSDDGSVRSETPVPPKPGAESPTLQKAMGMGSLEPDDLLFEAVATPEAAITKDETGAPAAPGNYLPPSLRQQGYRQCSIRFAVRANQLKLLESPGQPFAAAKLEVVAVLYDSQGNPVNSKKTKVSAAFDSTSDPRIEMVSVSADLNIQIPARGTYFLRLGVRDPTSDRVGALEIPADRIVLQGK